MGWCADFGCRISDGCDHAMVAGAKACTCQSCSTICKGKFHGCPDVWAAGPRAGDPPRLKMAPVRVDASTEADPNTDPRPSTVTLGEAIESLRRDIEGLQRELVATVRLGLVEGADNLEQLHDSVEAQGRAHIESLETLRREQTVLSDLMARQQAMLASVAEAQAAAIADLVAIREVIQRTLLDTHADEARSPYEKLIKDRRNRSLKRPTAIRDGQSGSTTGRSHLPRSPLADLAEREGTIRGADVSSSEKSDN